VAGSPFLLATLPGSGFRGSKEVNLIDGLRREHSRKPDEAYGLIEHIMLASAVLMYSHGRRGRDGLVGAIKRRSSRRWVIVGIFPRSIIDVRKRMQ
jgi:hypothetical protein